MKVRLLRFMRFSFDGHTDASIVTKIIDFGTEDINNLPNRTNAFKIPSSSEAVLIIANPQNLVGPFRKVILMKM